MDVSGSGNNFAQGHHYSYGPQYRSRFEEGLRKMPRIATPFKRFGISTIKLTMPSFIVLLFHTSVQLTHSLGGGTGSGVGTYVLSMLCDQFPKISRFSACVFPSELNDVVTSPYNTVLAMQQLCEHADCVFPLDNTALFQFARPPCQSGLFK